MAHTIWSEADRQALLNRFGRLSPEARPKWGSFDAPRMVTHVTDSIRASLGELKLTPFPGPLQYWPINVLVMFYLPWPKSAPTCWLHWTRRWTGFARWTLDRHALWSVASLPV